MLGITAVTPIRLPLPLSHLTAFQQFKVLEDSQDPSEDDQQDTDLFTHDLLIPPMARLGLKVPLEDLSPLQGVELPQRLDREDHQEEDIILLEEEGSHVLCLVLRGGLIPTLAPPFSLQPQFKYRLLRLILILTPS